MTSPEGAVRRDAVSGGGDTGPRLRTDRLDLLPIEARDAERLLAVFRDPEVRRFLLDDTLVEREWVKAEIVTSQALFERSGVGLWTVRHHDAEPIIGFVGFRHFFDPPELQLLYGLLPTEQGKGLATEAARAVVGHAFENADLDIVTAATDVPNAASERVMKRLGMSFDRRTDDGAHGTVFYSLSRDQTPENDQPR